MGRYEEKRRIYPFNSQKKVFTITQQIDWKKYINYYSLENSNIKKKKKLNHLDFKFFLFPWKGLMGPLNWE